MVTWNHMYAYDAGAYLFCRMRQTAGKSGGRSAVTVERIAINCEDCPSGFPDNAGNSPQGEKIYEDGADGYFSNLPIKAMVKKMMDNDVPASVSNTAGTYV